jgi:tRNA (guanine-N7-)-methyltransferase
MIPRASLAGVHVFFPDPWPKKRHTSVACCSLRSFLAGCALSPAATCTSRRTGDYAVEILVLTADRSSKTRRRDSRRVRIIVLTKFETRGLRLEHRVFDALFRRRADVAPRAASRA